MPLRHMRWRCFILAALLCLSCKLNLLAADEPPLSKEQIEQFLRTAKIIKSQPSQKGVTQTLRLTLTNGPLTHDASFQPIDEHKARAELTRSTELGFVDSYKYNIAAYRLAELLGLEDMLPVYIERTWHGNPGSLSWWLPVKMDEAERLKQHLEAPAGDLWNDQMYRVRVFDQLVYDTDANLTNLLIGEDWKIWRVDFTRAFRLYKELKDPDQNLTHCDKQLLERLKALDAHELTERTKEYLTKDEVKAVMARRDLIVEHFQKLISEKGEKEVLY
jgi:hypothetical protein